MRCPVGTRGYCQMSFQRATHNTVARGTEAILTLARIRLGTGLRRRSIGGEHGATSRKDNGIVPEPNRTAQMFPFQIILSSQQTEASKPEENGYL